MSEKSFDGMDFAELEKHLSSESNSEYHAWLGAVFVQRRGVDIMRELMLHIRQKRNFDMQPILRLVNDLATSCKNNEDHFVTLARLKDATNYTFSHPINVCIYSISIGSRLQYNDTQILRLGMAALLHDIGEARLPDRMLSKTSKYTESELSAMQRHPELGYEILKKDPAIPEDVLLGVLHHHERLDGSGYPSGHVGRFIHPLGKIIAVAEVFDAMTTSHMTPTDALKTLYGLAGKQYEPNVVKALIMLLGMYPMGSIVRISGGQGAVVLAKNKTDLSKPKIMVVTDANNQPIEPYIVDLLTDKSGRKIIYAEKSAESSIDPNKYIQEYLLNSK